MKNLILSLMLCVALVTYSQTQKNNKTDGNNGYLSVSFSVTPGIHIQMNGYI
jgi:hypothetical protein